MPTAPTKPKTTKADPVTGLTREQALEALQRLEERDVEAFGIRELSDEEKVMAAWLRDRDHLDGCPSITDERAGRLVEAYDEPIIAPGPAVRSLGLVAGQTVLVARCLKCGGMRYFAETLRDKMIADLRRLAGDDHEDADGALDESI
jgi:hypothetical protein